MRNEADQAVAGPAVQDRKNNRIDQDKAKVPCNDPRWPRGIMRRSKEHRPGGSHRPEGKVPHALPHKKAAEFDLFTQNGNGLVEQQQRQLIKAGHIDPPQHMIYIGTAEHHPAQQYLRNDFASHKALTEAELEAQKKEIIGKLEKGQILEGVTQKFLYLP